MTFAPFTAVALACAALLLSACGGGDAPTSDAGNPVPADRAQVQAVAPVTANDTVIVVYLPWLSAGNTVAFKSATGRAITLYKADGKTKVTSLDDLPIGLATHAWVRGTSTSGHLRVRFEPGVYRFKSGWAWPQAASGRSATSQIVLEQNPGTSGEVALLGSEAASATYRASAGKVTLATSVNTPFEQLWAEGGRAIRARTPNIGAYFYVRAGAQGWPASATDPTVVGSLNGSPVSRQAFQADPAGYQALAAIQNANDAQAVVMMMDSWQVTKHRVAELDSAGQRVRLSPASQWSLGAQGPGGRYFIENTASALDAPGEWHWSGASGTGTLFYIPSATRDGAKVAFEIPRVKKLLTIQGAVDAGKWAQYIQFSGLKFRYAKADMPAAGYVDGQADTGVSAAIELNDARHIVFDNCEVSHTGGHGIWFNRRVRSAAVVSSELYDLGAGGIKVGKSRPSQVFEVDWADVRDPNATGQNVVQGNRIHSLGHVYPGATGVWIGRSSDNQVVGNLIKDTTYSGISVGWTWDAGPTMASGNQVRNNFLHNIGQRALADMGGIYLLGRAPNTVVSGNVIKEVRSFDGYAHGGNGIYADEGSSELTVSGNIVLGVDGSGFTLHYGEDNRVSGNVFANLSPVFGIGRRLEDSAAVPLKMDNNRFLPSSNAMVGLSIDETLLIGRDTGNPTWVATAPVIASNQVGGQFLPAGTSLAIPTSVCTGCTASGVTLTDPAPLKVPQVSGMVFTPGQDIAPSWDAAPLSRSTSAARLWAGRIEDVPAKVIDFRASQWPLDARTLTGWQVIAQPGKAADAEDTTVPVSIRQDADGTQFLALADTVRSSFTWEPYIQSWLSYASGNAKVSFTARFDARTDLSHVWRSDDAGTTTGPELSLVARGAGVDVIVNGAVLMSVPTGVWVDFAVSSPIAANATWALSVTVAGQLRTFTGLAPGHAQWSYLGPILFISGANTQTTTAIKSIRATRL